MKRFYEILPGALLLSYAVYTAFVPVLSIAHSIILFSLAGVFGYSLFIYSQQQPSLVKELAELKKEMNTKLSEQQENYELRLKKVEDVAGALALSSTRVTSSSAPKKEFKF